MLVGAPLNLAMPEAMAGSAMAGAPDQNCREPGHSGSDRNTSHDHSALCLFCTAFGGPSLAGAGVEPVPAVSAAPFVILAFDPTDRTLSDERSTRTQYSRGPPSAV